jgi:hypothetical protein
MLGLGPCGDNLLVNPYVPEGYGRIELLDVPGRWGRADSYGRDRTTGRRIRVGGAAGERRGPGWPEDGTG